MPGSFCVWSGHVKHALNAFKHPNIRIPNEAGGSASFSVCIEDYAYLRSARPFL